MQFGKWRQSRWDAIAPIRGNRPHTLAARLELNDGSTPILEWPIAGNVHGAHLELRLGRGSLWVVFTLPGRPGSIAMRGLYAPDGELTVESLDPATPGVVRIVATGSSIGRFRAELRVVEADAGLIRWRVTLAPADDLLMPPAPWNLYPLDADGDPSGTRGIVHATQRGTAAGVLYFSVVDPPLGNVFYFQNLTALNDYCAWTRTSADSIVTQNWPGLGFLPPPSDEHPLPAGVEVVVCDAYARLDPRLPTDESQAARLFLDALARVYLDLSRPATRDHDWPGMARATRRDLEQSSKLSVEEQGHLYLRPYTSAEYPDSMVQLAVLLPLREYAAWLGAAEDALAGRLRAGVPNFFDAKLGTLRRYLATVGEDKDADAVDCWYLYHPVANLGRLAAEGDADARAMFLRGVAFGIRVARHFDYRFPVQFNLRTLEVVTQDRKPGELGQTDVPGLYAYVMHQAYELTKDEQYLDEANRALDALGGLGFTIGYQFNNVAWGIAACLRMFKTTGDPNRLAQADVFLASFMHNTNVWECKFGPAEHYPTFMGVTCLHDGPYMAAYEEFEAYCAFTECLQLAEDDLRPASRLLMSEYCRYALDRCWSYYPGNLPRHILAAEVRNGHVDRSLAIPLEDLYADWTRPGSVGQETYGAGMAFAFVSRAYRRVTGAPFVVYCDVPFCDFIVKGDRLTMRLLGDAVIAGRLVLIPAGDGFDPSTILVTAGRRLVEAAIRPDRAAEYAVPAAGRVTIEWRTDAVA